MSKSLIVNLGEKAFTFSADIFVRVVFTFGKTLLTHSRKPFVIQRFAFQCMHFSVLKTAPLCLCSLFCETALQAISREKTLKEEYID